MSNKDTLVCNIYSMLRSDPDEIGRYTYGSRSVDLEVDLEKTDCVYAVV
jgi:hypothetical protein